MEPFEQSADDAPPVRRFQFLLRELLYVTVLAALVLGWWIDRRQFEARLARVEGVTLPQTIRSSSWGTEQVTGPPNTAGWGDISTAWASSTPDGRKEWLLLQYARPLRPAAVVIHETYNPGAVYKVTALAPRGSEVVLWTGTDPTPPTANRGVSRIPVSPQFKTRRIKVYLNSPAVPGWNEIDAVGLLDATGKTHWATSAEASTSYGENMRLTRVGWWRSIFGG